MSNTMTSWFQIRLNEIIRHRNLVIITQVILKGEMYTFLDFKVFNPDKCTETAVSKQF